MVTRLRVDYPFSDKNVHNALHQLEITSSPATADYRSDPHLANHQQFIKIDNLLSDGLKKS